MLIVISICCVRTAPTTCTSAIHLLVGRRNSCDPLDARRYVNATLLYTPGVCSSSHNQNICGDLSTAVCSADVLASYIHSTPHAQKLVLGGNQRETRRTSPMALRYKPIIGQPLYNYWTPATIEVYHYFSEVPQFRRSRMIYVYVPS